jgi:hypothetical protein
LVESSGERMRVWDLLEHRIVANRLGESGRVPEQVKRLAVAEFIERPHNSSSRSIFQMASVEASNRGFRPRAGHMPPGNRAGCHG